MITKMALQEWLNDLPIDAHLAIDECGSLVALEGAQALDIGEPPADWCSSCGELREEHTADCEFHRWQIAQEAQQASQHHVIPFHRRAHATAPYLQNDAAS